MKGMLLLLLFTVCICEVQCLRPTKRLVGSILISSSMICHLPFIAANAEESDSSKVPCPGKYCRSDTKLNIIHTLGIPGISDRKFKDRKDFLKVNSWSSFEFDQKGSSSHEFDCLEYFICLHGFFCR